MAEYVPPWQQRNIDAGLPIHYNLTAVEAGLMTHEDAMERASSEAARQGRITDENPYGVDTSIRLVSDGYEAAQSSTGMAFQDWLEAQGIYEEWVAGEHMMAYDQWKLRPADLSGRGLYVGDSDVEGAVGSTYTAYTDPSDYKTSTEFLTLKDGFLSELTRIGLDTDTINELWDWVEGRFVADPSFTAAQAQIEMYDQKAFKDRFPGITAMREETGRRDIPTPGEYLARERLWATYLGEYGMTALGADLDQLVAESYINAIGEGEFVERLDAAREMIYEAPEAVKNTFGDWFGHHADAALMAAFLDPNDDVFGGKWKNWIGLKGDVAAAEVGGWSKMRLGLDAPVSQERSRAISKLGWRDIDVWQGLDDLKAKEDLFIERIGEVDYQMEVEGVAAEFGINTEDLSGVELAELLDRRGARRTADFSGGGGAMLTGTTTGFGAANA